MNTYPDLNPLGYYVWMVIELELNGVLFDSSECIIKNEFARFRRKHLFGLKV